MKINKLFEEVIDLSTAIIYKRTVLINGKIRDYWDGDFSCRPVSRNLSSLYGAPIEIRIEF
jgi:hypothetical protein